MDGLAGDPGRLGHVADVQIASLDMPKDLVMQFLLGLSRRRLELENLVCLPPELRKHAGLELLCPIAFLSITRQTASVACHQSPIANPWPRSLQSPGNSRRPGR